MRFNAYKGARGIKTKVSGHKKIGRAEDVHEYDSKLEARGAKIFIAAGIPYEPHVKFECKDRNTDEPFTYTVDFLFKTPQKFVGIPYYVNGIEVKGPLCHHDTDRIEALRYKHDKRIWIATQPMIDMWENEGLFRKTSGQVPKREKKNKKR
ncbi:MAG: hypothetical protein Q7R94_02400 [bacterium]|nr:hypothetical protein [bacterium]